MDKTKISRKYSNAQKRILGWTRPNPKLYFILEHLDPYLRIVNQGREKLLGLRYFSEEVVESSHQNFAKFYSSYFCVEHNLLKALVRYNASHLGFTAE